MALVDVLRDIVGLPPRPRCESCDDPVPAGRKFCDGCTPEAGDVDRPLCRSGLCRDRGILADHADGYCFACHDARGEDTREAAAEAKRDPPDPFLPEW